MSNPHHISIKNDLGDLPKVMQWFENLGESSELDMKLSMNLALCLEEALSNVIFYAYPKGEVGTIEVTFTIESEVARMAIEDKGIAFNPLTDAKIPDTEAALEDREIGGLGIHFIKELMDKVSYQRTEETNQLEFSKRI